MFSTFSAPSYSPWPSTAGACVPPDAGVVDPGEFGSEEIGLSAIDCCGSVDPRTAILSQVATLTSEIVALSGRRVALEVELGVTVVRALQGFVDCRTGPLTQVDGLDSDAYAWLDLAGVWRQGEGPLGLEELSDRVVAKALALEDRLKEVGLVALTSTLALQRERFCSVLRQITGEPTLASDWTMPLTQALASGDAHGCA